MRPDPTIKFNIVFLVVSLPEQFLLNLHSETYIHRETLVEQRLDAVLPAEDVRLTSVD